MNISIHLLKKSYNFFENYSKMHKMYTNLHTIIQETNKWCKCTRNDLVQMYKKQTKLVHLMQNFLEMYNNTCKTLITQQKSNINTDI